MDPMSVLAVTAAALQFLDFGAKILTNAIEIHKSAQGRPSTYLEVSEITSELAKMAAEVDTRSTKITCTSDASETEQIFLRSCIECKAIGAELHSLLSSLQREGTTRLERAKLSISAALKSISTGRRVDQLTERLGGIRQQLMMAMMVFTWCVFSLLTYYYLTRQLWC